MKDRVIYYYKTIKKEMKDLLEEVKECSKECDVIVMTENNFIPELKEYANVISPKKVSGHELRGEFTPLFCKIIKPIRTQIVIWTEITLAIGGIESFIYNFCQNMYKSYDITVLYSRADAKQLERLSKIVKVVRNERMREIHCDTVIVNRVTDTVPSNVKYKKKIQMVHGCSELSITVPKDNDEIVYVSKSARDSFGDKKGVVINNFTYPKDGKVLKLLSCTRLTREKGGARMVQLSEMLKEKKVPFIWFIFSDSQLMKDKKIYAPDEIVYMKPMLGMDSFIKMCDYVVQLSDTEGFGYAIIEALENNTPLLVTPVDTLKEFKFQDKKHGFILPFDMKNIDVEEIYSANLKFDYKYNNKAIKSKWDKIIYVSDEKNTKKYDYHKYDTLIANQDYYDLEQDKMIKKGTIFIADKKRAKFLTSINKEAGCRLCSYF